MQNQKNICRLTQNLTKVKAVEGETLLWNTKFQQSILLIENTLIKLKIRNHMDNIIDLYKFQIHLFHTLYAFLLHFDNVRSCQNCST